MSNASKPLDPKATDPKMPDPKMPDPKMPDPKVPGPKRPDPKPAPAYKEPTDSSPDGPSKRYVKTLRLTSDQLVRYPSSNSLQQKMLNLHPGPNTIIFSATSSYSGQATCSARIFLWEATDQVVISDIDGTITKFVTS